MRIVFALVLFASACSGICAKTAAGEHDQKNMLASLLATFHQPTAISQYSSETRSYGDVRVRRNSPTSNFAAVPKIRIERDTPFRFDANGWRFKIPFKFNGRKFISGIEAVGRGVRLTLPITSHFHEIDRFRPRASDFKAELEYPMRVEISGVPVSIPLGYGNNRLSYPVKFRKQGVDVEVPLSSIVEDDGNVINGGFFPSQIEGKLTRPLEFYLGGQRITVPLKYESGKVTGEIEWKVRGSVFTLPIRFRPRYFAKLSEGSAGFNPEYHLKRVKGKIEYPLNFTLGDSRGGSELFTSFRDDRRKRRVERDRDPLRERSLDEDLDFEPRRPRNRGDTSRERERERRRDDRSERGETMRKRMRGFPWFSVPVSFDIFSIKYPVKWSVNEWNFEIPLVYHFGSGTNYDGRTLNDFEVVDIEGRHWNLRNYMSRPVLVVDVSSKEDISELAELQRKYSSSGLQIIAVVAEDLIDKEVRQFEKSRFSTRWGRSRRLEREGLILMGDEPSPFLAWLHNSQRRMFGFASDKFLIGQNGRPMANFGQLSLLSYEQAISRELKSIRFLA